MQSFFPLLLSLLYCSSAAAQYDLIEIDESHIPALLPAHFINHMGFELPESNRFDARLFGNPSKIYPMFPLYKGKFGAKNFIGVRIPQKYFNPGGVPIAGNLIASAEIVAKIYGIPAADMDVIQQQMRDFEVEEGVSLYPVFYKGDLYGIRSDYQVQFVNSTSVGFSLSFGGSSKVVNMGKSSEWGLHAHVGFSPTHMGGVTGINLASSVNDLFAGIDLMINGDRAEKLLETTLQLTPYLQYQLLDNFDRPKGVSIFGQLLPAKYNGNVPLETPRTSQRVTVDPNYFSDEFEDIQGQLKKNLMAEVKWKSKVATPVSHTPIYPDESANRLIQRLCDHLAKAYKIDESIWPRCRIAATVVPNAWAYPGGDIFIAAGLIGTLQDMESLMYVIGHEIGHVFARHTSQMMPAYDTYSVTMNALGIANSVYSLGGGLGTLGSVTFANWFFKSFASSFVTSYPGKVVAYAGAAGLMHFSRNNERQSDRLGHATALAAGTHPQAIEKGWQDFMNYFSTYMPRKLGWLDKLLASHPSGDERLASIKKRNQKLYQDYERFTENSLPQSDRDEYKELHELMSGYTVLYGEYIKAQTEEKSLTGSPLNKTDQLFLASFGSAASQCIFEVFDLHAE